MHKKLIIIGFAFLLLNFNNFSYAQEEETLVILHTNSGDLVLEFFSKDAPNHVENFVKLASEGSFDRTVFHRVIKDFMIQGGDLKTKPGNFESFREWGTGNPGYSIDAEFNDIKHNRGIVSMARSADPNSAGSQFFIVHKDSNFLDGQYTVFGRLATQESYDVLDKIALLNTPHSRGTASSSETGATIPMDWGKAEILSAEVVNRSEISNLLNLGEPERVLSSPVVPPNSIGSIGNIGGLYSDQELGIFFMAPEGWSIQNPEKTSPIVPDIVIVGPINAGMNPTISITIDSADGESLELRFAKKMNTLQQPIDEGLLEIISEEKITIVNKEAYAIQALGKFDVGGNTINVKFNQVLIATPEKFYTLTYTNEENNFEKHLDKFNTVLDSFAVESDFEEISNDEITATEGGGCLIATATFGSELSSQVQQLRELRDNTVLNTKSGTAFMTGFNQFYYSFSPTIADWERENPIFKEFVKVAITPLLATLSILNHVDIDSDEEMLGYGIGIILMNVGMYFVVPAMIVYRLRK